MRYDVVDIDWGVLLDGMVPILSEKDMNGPKLELCDNQFVFKINC